MTKAEVLATTVGKGAHVNLTTGRLVNYGAFSYYQL